MEGQTLNLKHYVSVLTHLAFQAAAIVKECAENPDLKKYEKGYNDPVTDADFKIQTMLCRGISHFFPTLKIIGEESTEYKGEIKLDLSAIGLQNYPHNVELSQNVPISELIVWIDPIDNTKGFIKGTLDAVTVLIGMSRNGRSFLGILALPYQFDGQNNIFKPEVLMGTVEGKKAFSISLEGNWTEMHNPKPNSPLKFVITDSRNVSNVVTQLAQKHKAELHRIGGAGKKIVEVIKGKMDLLLYYGRDICKWDSCAGQAIILALGGYFSDKFNKPIIYDPKVSVVNQDGSFCGFGQEFYSLIMKDIKVLGKL